MSSDDTRGNGNIDRTSGGSVSLSAVGSASYTIPAGHLVVFDLVGGGGGGGHWGGDDGQPGTRVRGTIAARRADWTVTIHCGDGGHVDDDTSGGGPALGGSGGRGYVGGGDGGWGTNWAAGGGGGGGGASAIVSRTADVHVVAPGGGGGGGGSDPQGASPDRVPRGGHGADGTPPANGDAPGLVDHARAGGNGGNGTSRHRKPGGGGGGGGGGWPAGRGGSGGSGGGAGESGRSGAFDSHGVVWTVAESAVASTERTHARIVTPRPGAGGTGGRKTAEPDSSGDDDPRTADPGCCGSVRLTWMRPGHLADQTLRGMITPATSTTIERDGGARRIFGTTSER